MKIVLCIVGLSVTIVVVIAASMASHDFLGQTLLESAVEMVAVVSFSLVLTSLLWALGLKLKKRGLVYLAMVLSGVFVGLHLRASMALAPLKVQFNAIAGRGPVKIDWAVAEDSEGTYNAASFGGNLKRLIDRRDQRLSAMGYTGVGAWMYSNGGVRTTMVYIYAPWPSSGAPALMARGLILGWIVIGVVMATVVLNEAKYTHLVSPRAHCGS